MSEGLLIFWYNFFLFWILINIWQVLFTENHKKHSNMLTISITFMFSFLTEIKISVTLDAVFAGIIWSEMIRFLLSKVAEVYIRISEIDPAGILNKCIWATYSLRTFFMLENWYCLFKDSWKKDILSIFSWTECMLPEISFSYSWITADENQIKNKGSQNYLFTSDFKRSMW